MVQPLVNRASVIGPPEVYASLGLTVIADQEFGVPHRGEIKRSKGPLAGIATALRNASTPWNIILACDLPYLNREWMAWLMNRCTQSDAQVILPQTSRGLEPVAAMYRADCAEPIVREISRGVSSVIEALRMLRVEVVTESNWKEFDADGSVLNNMNEPPDYESARTWWNAKTAANDCQLASRP